MENRDVINTWLKSKQQGPPWFAPGAFTAGWTRSIRLGFPVYTTCVQGRVIDLYFTHDGEFIGIDYFNEADQDSDNTIHTDDAVKAYGRTRVAPAPNASNPNAVLTPSECELSISPSRDGGTEMREDGIRNHIPGRGIEDGKAGDDRACPRCGAQPWAGGCSTCMDRLIRQYISDGDE